MAAKPTNKGLHEPVGPRDVCSQLKQMVELLRAVNEILGSVVDEEACKASVARISPLFDQLAAAGRCYKESQRASNLGGDPNPHLHEYATAVNNFNVLVPPVSMAAPKGSQQLLKHYRYQDTMKPYMDLIRVSLPRHLR